MIIMRLALSLSDHRQESTQCREHSTALYQARTERQPDNTFVTVNTFAFKVTALVHIGPYSGEASNQFASKAVG